MEIVKFSFQEQKSQIDKIVKELNNLGLSAKRKQSRYQKEYNALEIKTTLELSNFFDSLGYKVNIQETPTEIKKIISGKYHAVTVTDISDKFQFYCVNTYTEKGSIKTKELSPDSLGLAGIKFTSTQQFKTKVLQGIEKVNVDNSVKAFMVELYNAAENSISEKIQYTQKLRDLFKLIKPQDLQAIGKDFGEIISLRWILNQKEFSKFESFGYPSASNEPLVDYSVFINIDNREIRVEFSAKFEQGAAPSINAIVNNIDKTFKNPTVKEKEYIGVLKSLSGKGVSSNILSAFKSINHPAYKNLQNIVGANVTVETISNYISKNISKNYVTSDARISQFEKTFSEFYKIIGKSPSRESLNVIFKTDSYKKLHSPIVSPLGYFLVDIMNNDEQFNIVLNTVARDIEVQQVYLDLKQSYMEFEVKKFSEAEFSFSYGANAKDSDNTGIKFKMKRSGKTTTIEKK